MVPSSEAGISHPVDLASLLRKVTGGVDLSLLEAEGLFGTFMSGEAGDARMAAFLAALRTKGASPSEVAGGVRALRGAMVPVPARDRDSLVDTAGTGGGSVTTFNISTAAALTAAGAGVRLAKHGNRSFTSRCGSADVLEVLGVRIDLTPERMGEVLEEVGIVFMFAPLLHPAMRHVGPVRRALGITTIMNLLGPLTNPAGARRQVIGVADPELLPLAARSMEQLGHLAAWVVHGSPGIDELSPGGATRVAELVDGTVREYEVTPESFGQEALPLDGLAGGEPEENAALIRKLLAGGGPPVARSAVVMNAAAAIYVAGGADSLRHAAERAEASLDEGAAGRALEALAETSNA